MSELPFLKNKKNQGIGGPSTVQREPDDGSSDLLGMVADELLSAFEKKDKEALIHALRAFVLMIQDEDQEQDDEGEMS